MEFFFVFQNRTFDREQQGGYLWAPDGCRAHWQKMRSVTCGDIIFHSYQRKIVAISIAKTECYTARRPTELAIEQLWDDQGLRVDCDYYLLPSTLDTHGIMSDLLKLQPKKYAPFNKSGKGNRGYLFDCSASMASFLLNALIQSDSNREVIQHFQKILLNL